jgi:hypothetical protein
VEAAGAVEAVVEEVVPVYGLKVKLSRPIN